MRSKLMDQTKSCVRAHGLTKSCVRADVSAKVMRYELTDQKKSCVRGAGTEIHKSHAYDLMVQKTRRVMCTS